MTFFGLKPITQPINPNPYPNQTPSKDSTKKYPPPPRRGVWIHTFLWQLNLCLFCIELKNLLDITKKGTECHAYSIVGDRE